MIMKDDKKESRKAKNINPSSLLWGFTFAALIMGAFSMPPYFLGAPFAIGGIGFGVMTYREKSKSNAKLAVLFLPILGIIINTSVVLLAALSIIHDRIPPVHYDRMLCGSNLAGLAKTIHIYAYDNNGKYPSVDNWCDLITTQEEEYSDFKDIFVCRGNRDERCSYAMNPNAEPNSQSIVVLLFETKGGWNQYGGPELLTTENHPGEGCNIVFNDGHVEFVPKEQFGDLKWKDMKKE
jgi:prepilin-type processing-associated H-X9-DG protein